MTVSNADGNQSTVTTGSTVTESVESFVTAVTDALADSDADDDAVEAVRESGEELAHDVADLEARVEVTDEQVEDVSEDVDEIQQHAGRERAELSRRVSDVENTVEDVDLSGLDPTPQEDETALQRHELTPIERLTTDGDVEDVTNSASVERAVTIFESITDWGRKTPKGYTIRPEDNPLALLEAAEDESLSWRQWYRAAETLESLSKGAVTFFDSDRHGKTLVLHEKSEVHDRVTNGSLTVSSVGERA